MRFGFRAAPADPGREAADAVKALVRTALALPDAVGLTASEIVCRDPACPGTETVVLVMAPDAPTRALKIALPMAEIGAAEVAAALAACAWAAAPVRPGP